MTTMTTMMMIYPTIVIPALATLKATLKIRVLAGVTNHPLATLKIVALAGVTNHLPVTVKSRPPAVVKIRALAIVKKPAQATVKIQELAVARIAPVAKDEQRPTAPGTLSSFQQRMLHQITTFGLTYHHLLHRQHATTNRMTGTGGELWLRLTDRVKEFIRRYHNAPSPQLLREIIRLVYDIFVMPAIERPMSAPFIYMAFSFPPLQFHHIV